MTLKKEDYEDLLYIAWCNRPRRQIHSCGGKYNLNISDFDGKTLWINMVCTCGFKEKYSFQLMNVKKGEWKPKETGPILITDEEDYNVNTGEIIND